MSLQAGAFIVSLSNRRGTDTDDVGVLARRIRIIL
jgi:hypothetical protein